ncbi:MAG: formate dehydrogenase accessory sulfurtransferase FdhD [Gammaproteobacteria bacterium]|nr:formate dehydrogenase accessory sulfurtransferase FdhD [Gammaproteobacteria bacterium]
MITLEEPLEIRLAHGSGDARTEQTISITMRTPGQDSELALGFLFTEGIVASANDVDSVEHCGPPSPDKGLQNVVKVELAPGVEFDSDLLARHFYTTSSCGVCGKTSIAAVRVNIPEYSADDTFSIDAATLGQLPARLTKDQGEFNRTGGLHASGLFDTAGKVAVLREDVGRHNALDKLVGSQLDAGTLPLHDRGIILSGRASFELLQKAAMAGCPFVASIGPPSSLAVELAEEQGISLVGFLKTHRFNIYTHPERITR